MAAKDFNQENTYEQTENENQRLLQKGGSAGVTLGWEYCVGVTFAIVNSKYSSWCVQCYVHPDYKRYTSGISIEHPEVGTV